MKHHLSQHWTLIVVVAILLATCSAAKAAVTTTFTYQGRLNANGGPATGLYDFEFRLFGGETNITTLAGPSNASAVWVTNGSFQAEIDFGAGMFTGDERWLEIAVQCTECDGLPVTLSPRQKLTATPQSLFALTAGGLATYAGAPLDITLNGERVMRFQPATSPTLGFVPNIIGGVEANHADPGVIGSTIGGGGSADAPNGIVTATSHSMPSPPEFGTIGGGLGNTIRGVSHVTIGGGAYNSVSMWEWYLPTAPKLHSVIAGGVSNGIAGGWMSSISGGAFNYMQGDVGHSIVGGTIGGGVLNGIGTIEDTAYYPTIAGGYGNGIVQGKFASIGGGDHNYINNDSTHSTISGGGLNRIGSAAESATISGGYSNQISPQAHNGVIGGGVGNLIQPLVVNATIGGGSGNQIQTPEGRQIENATISGGNGNILWSAEHATIGGGISNRINLGSYGGFIGGGEANGMDVYCNYAVIGGGSANSMRFADHSVIGGGRRNRMGDSARYSTIAGGSSNMIGRDAFLITISGGSLNTVVQGAHGATIGGGQGNWIGFDAIRSVISGGESNQANGPYSTVAGGQLNIASGMNSFAIGYGVRAIGDNSTAIGADTEASGEYATAMGQHTMATGLVSTAIGFATKANGSYSTAMGQDSKADGFVSTAMGNNTLADGWATTAMGENSIAKGRASVAMGQTTKASGWASTAMGAITTASGDFSTAMGRRARATNEGAFVWADTEESDFTSTGTNQFLIRASGGVGINTESPLFALHVNGDAGKPGGGAWSVASDARLKKDVRPLEQALARLLKLHGVTYEYKNPAAIHELPGQQTGMIAQEVEKVFPEWVEAGRDGMKRLSVRGFEALAVEALRDLRNEKDAQIQSMEKRLAAIEAKLGGGAVE